MLEFNLNSKIGRSEYFISKVFTVLATLFVFMTGYVLKGNLIIKELLFCLAALYFVVAVIILSVQRLNDLKWNRWLVLLLFIPTANFILVVLLLFARGKNKLEDIN